MFAEGRGKGGRPLTSRVLAVGGFSNPPPALGKRRRRGAAGRQRRWPRGGGRAWRSRVCSPQSVSRPVSLRVQTGAGCLPPIRASLCVDLTMWLSADPDVVSLEAADRPNFFLHVTANGSLELAKWQGSDTFHHHASFSLHQGTWRAGLVALESLAEPGSFLHVSGPTLALRPYEHSEVFRRGTLFRLLGRCPPCHHPQPLAQPPLSPSPYSPSKGPQEMESSLSWHQEATWVPP